MRKVFIMSVLALAVSGCANQQQNTPQVRDLSEARRAVADSPQYTVKTGDTLYGIAWQHNLDYRQLCKSTILMRLIKFTQAKPLRCVKERRHQVTRQQAPLPQSALRRALLQQD